MIANIYLVSLAPYLLLDSSGRNGTAADALDMGADIIGGFTSTGKGIAVEAAAALIGALINGVYADDIE